MGIPGTLLGHILSTGLGLLPSPKSLDSMSLIEMVDDISDAATCLDLAVLEQRTIGGVGCGCEWWLDLLETQLSAFRCQ